MKKKSMKSVEDFIIFDNRKTPDFYQQDLNHVSLDLEPLDLIIPVLFSFLFSIFFILAVSNPLDLNIGFINFLFATFIFATTFLFLKRNEISHNFNVSIKESYRKTFENTLIYNEERFNDLMYIVYNYLNDEEKNRILNNAITKNFSSEDFHTLYNACVQVKKNSLSFIETLNKENNVIFFDKK